MIETIVKQQIIIAAATITGGDESLMPAAVNRLARQVAPGSALMQAIDREAEQVESAPAEKPFPGTLVHVDLELSSKRGVIFLQNMKGEKEVLRTDITTGNPGAQDRIRALNELIGHRMLFTKRIESSRDNKFKVRILDSFEDKGIDPEVEADRDQFVMDWDAWDAGKSKPKSDGLKRASEGQLDLLPTFD